MSVSAARASRRFRVSRGRLTANRLRDRVELPTTSATALREAGFDIIENQQPSFLLDRSVLITGEVPRVSGYEPGFPIQQAWIGEVWQPDPLVLDDQALIVNVRGKGLIVISGCGHAGMVNISRYARRLTGEQPLHALLGGFHLNGPLFEPLIPRVLDDLALRPSSARSAARPHRRTSPRSADVARPASQPAFALCNSLRSQVPEPC